LGERLLDAVRREEFHYQDIRIPFTVSVGVAEFMPGETVPSWLERVDRALYRAKDRGRDQLCLAVETTGTVQEF
jgi:PleD family two-component response regulator